MIHRIAPALLVLLTLATAAHAQTQTAPSTKPARYIKEIEAFEAKDRQKMPPTNGILFIGSSSIRIWKVDESFPNLPVINRGFGGSAISDSVNYFERIVLPYKPKMIVFYAGDNDIAAGKTPKKVASDLQAFLDKTRKSLPETRFVFIGIKPSVKRWSMIDRMRDANRLIQDILAKDPLSTYVSVEEDMLTPDGQPRADLLRDDGLHMNERGYEIWNKKLTPLVEAAGASR